MIAELTGRQIRAGRGLLGWTAMDLAKASKVGVATIRRAEVGDGPVRMIAGNISALIRTLEEQGVQLLAENGGGAGARMRVPDPQSPPLKGEN